MNFKKLNIVTGWIVFLVAAYTYIATIEPTASFWDCGEFLATANKLEVGHPPGAPLFMLLARVASAFVSQEHVPIAVNILSALASAFTILFLFWSITHLAKKLALSGNKEGEELSTGQLIAVLGSGIVGALAYTWSDSFWFSAVEAEVYASSSFFTAITFWAILKWESEAHEPHNTRWLVLICYLLGLGIGIQLLALLCIPAIGLVYYFKKYETTTKGVIYALVICAIVLGTIQAIIIPGVANVAGWFELVFVNDMGLPFNTGNLVYGVLFVGLTVWGLVWTQRKGRVILNTIILGIATILLGYSTYAMTVIRSLANPPIDENNPENVFNLVSYLNREQYGSRPLIYGQFWDSPTADADAWTDGTPVRTAAWTAMKGDKKVKVFYDAWSAEQFVAGKTDLTIKQSYDVTDKREKSEVAYDPDFTMVFPRMYSSQADHKDQYKEWSKFKGTPVRYSDPRTGKTRTIMKPTFGENMRFFMDYQVNWMYWRYFLWNFAGRQNDVQGHGNILDGNWYTGLKFIDAERLGNQDHLTSNMTRNKGMNKLYLLPMILGLVGFVYQLVRNLKDWSVVMLLFFFTGIAIVIYLNQYPHQPRERDYAYVGSFYAFAMWIGLGVYALFDAARRITARELGFAVGGTIGLGVLKYLVETLVGDDHSISLSLLYMGAVSGGALGLFHLLGRSLKNEAVIGVLATMVGLIVPVVMVAAEWDDHDRSGRLPARDLAADYLNSCAPNAILFTNGDNDTFPLWYAQEVEGIRTDIRVVNLSLLNTDWYIDQMRRKAYDSDPVPFRMDPAKYRQGTRDVVALFPPDNDKVAPYKDLKAELDFATDDRNMRELFSLGQKDAYMRTNKFSLPVDSAHVIANGTVTIKDTANIVDAVRWQINKQVVLKNHLMLLDLLAHFNWDRPVYFAVTTGPDAYIGLSEYFQLEGLTYRLVPVRTPRTRNQNPNLAGRVASDVMLEHLKDFKWGNMDTPGKIYLDENILRMTTNLRLQLGNLADQLVAEGRKDEAKKVLDMAVQMMPEKNVPYDRIMIPMIEGYYAVGDMKSANALSKRLFDLMDEDMQYYLSLEPEFAAKSNIKDEMQITHMVLDRLVDNTLTRYAQKDPGDTMKTRFEEIQQEYAQKLQELNSMGRRVIKASF